MPPRNRAAATRAQGRRLDRTVFTTSRLVEFCSVKELTAQTGHSPEDWPLVVLKELADNALDAAEAAGIPPALDIKVSNEAIVIVDNGTGIAAETVSKVLDFNVRASDKEAYVSPTRGAQGNALKTVIAMAFALDGTSGQTEIEAQGIAHKIVFAIDPVRRAPRLTHTTEPSFVRNGTCVTVRWPGCACSKLTDAKPRFLQIAEDFTFLNPHLSLRLVWDEEELLNVKAVDPSWRKWSPADPIPAHWYDPDRFERLIAATIAHDQDNNRETLVREFLATFRGLSGSAKQKALLDQIGGARLSLAAFFNEGRNRAGLPAMLTAMQAATKPVKPADLGMIGKDNLAARFAAAGCAPDSFNYQKVEDTEAGLPYVVEIAFGVNHAAHERRLTTGVNFSPGISNPFRSLGTIGHSLDTILANQRANRGEPVQVLVHLTSPRLSFTDRGKSALALGGSNWPPYDDEDDE